MGNPEAVSGLLQILHLERNPVLLNNVIYSLEEIADERAVQPLIEILLSHPAMFLRSSAAYALKNFTQAEVISALILALKDSDAHVGIKAAYSLASIKSPLALPFLIEAMSDFRKRPEWNDGIDIATSIVALAATEAVHSYDTAATNEIVLEWCISKLNNEIIKMQQWIIGKLEALKDKRAIPVLEDLLHKTDIQNPKEISISISIQNALQAIGTPEALAALEKWQQNQNNQP